MFLKAGLRCSYTDAQRMAMSKEEMMAEVAFLELCLKEMPSDQTRYDLSILKNNLFLFHGVGSIASQIRELQSGLAKGFPRTAAEQAEDDELVRLIEEMEALESR